MEEVLFRSHLIQHTSNILPYMRVATLGFNASKKRTIAKKRKAISVLNTPTVRRP